VRKLFPVVVLFVCCVPAVIWANDTAPAEPNVRAGANTGEQGSEPRLEYGVDLRVRTENWNNIQDANDHADDERHHVRFRSRAWARWSTSYLNLYVRLANEFRKQTTPAAPLNLDEAFFDAFYVDLKRLAVPGLSLRVGRQDFTSKGEGLIFADGTAGDGSRSLYFNGLDLSYGWRRSKLELIGVFDPRQDRFFPVLHDQHKYLTEWNEQGLGVYYTGRHHPQTDVDGYFFHKKEFYDYRPQTNRMFQSDRHLETAGLRIVRRLPKAFTATSEVAFQWGAQHPAIPIRAWALTSSFKKELSRSWKPYFLIGYTGLAGDDPGTTKRYEGWDPLFARNPKWSDLYLYALTPERGVGYWSNLNMWQAEVGATPLKRASLRATISRLGAWHSLGQPANVFGSGALRGTAFLVRTDLTLRPGTKVHLQYEKLLPGDFYSHNSPGYFLRAEISYEYKGRFGMVRTK